MKKQIDFLSYKWVALILSAAMIAGSVFIWIDRGNSKYGVDFLGGQELLVKVERASSPDEIRNTLEESQIQGSTVQSFDFSADEFSIRLALQDGISPSDMQKRIVQALENKVGQVIVQKNDTVGAVIGEEIRSKALWAIALGIIGILIYISARFEFSYALGAVVAVFHDVIVATGIYLLGGHEINGAALAAALTILGYSVNDTIVIFDRVREERHKRPGEKLEKIINDSMNFCLSRTLITSGLTLLAAISLLVLGGGSIQDLSWFLTAGLIVGSYSTIYIAAPVALFWENIRKKGRKS